VGLIEDHFSFSELKQCAALALITVVGEAEISRRREAAAADSSSA
jgi:hypothetical protein